MNYRKRGSAARWENGTLVEVCESGVASETAGTFSCRPDPVDALPPFDARRVLDVARVIGDMILPPLRVERLVVSEGIAEHRIGNASWTEHHERIHLSVVHGRMRALIDLGALDPAPVAVVAEALRRSDGVERDPPARLRLAPSVAAALLPSLVGIAPPNVTLWQTGGGLDGKGLPINDIPIVGAPWPNWYRPSYRVRPVRFPINLRLEGSVTEIETSRPCAVALLSAVSGLELRVLVDDGEHAFPATVRPVRVDAVARERVWYPYGAGVFGSEMML